MCACNMQNAQVFIIYFEFGNYCQKEIVANSHVIYYIKYALLHGALQNCYN